MIYGILFLFILNIKLTWIYYAIIDYDNEIQIIIKTHTGDYWQNYDISIFSFSIDH